MKLQIAQWNCRSLAPPYRKKEAKDKLAAFQTFSHDFDIIILVETWLKPDRKFDVEGFTVIRNDREEKRGGGVAILIRNGWKYEDCAEIRGRDLEVLAIKVIGESNDIVIAACYKPHKNISPHEWNNFFKQLTECGSFVLAGDFNAHHPMWNCEKEKSEGTKLQMVINAYNCKVHNTKHRSHVGNKICPPSNLDLIITGSDLADRVSTRQSHDSMGSDHFPVECVIDFE